MILQHRKLAMVALLPLALAACSDMAGSAGSAGTMASGSQACLAAVRAQTNTQEVMMTGQQSSEAGTTYDFAVGPNAAPWTCAADAAGNTSVMSMTNEGSL